MIAFIPSFFIQYGVLQHSCRRAYFAQYCRQMRVLFCSLKVTMIKKLDHDSC